MLSMLAAQAGDNSNVSPWLWLIAGIIILCCIGTMIFPDRGD